MPEEQTEETQESNENTTAEEQEAKTLTQDEIDAIVENRLARERAKYSDYDDLKAKAEKLSELEDANKSETERLSEKAAEAEKRAAQAEARAMRLEVAVEKGLPADLAERLTGDSLEELEADAEKLAEYLKPPEDDEGSAGGIRRSPQEKLRTGATSDSEGTRSPEELAASIRKARDGGLTL